MVHALRLIATADGLSLYEKLGFRETGHVFQHQGVVGQVPHPAHVEAATAADLAEMTAIDRDAFWRRPFFADFRNLREIGEFAVIRRDGRITGLPASVPSGGAR